MLRRYEIIILSISTSIILVNIYVASHLVLLHLNPEPEQSPGYNSFYFGTLLILIVGSIWQIMILILTIFYYKDEKGINLLNKLLGFKETLTQKDYFFIIFSIIVLSLFNTYLFDALPI